MVVDAKDSASKTKPVVTDRAIRLTKREIEVACLIIDGKASKEVADALYVSKRTIDFHIANIYDKLQVSNRVQLLRRCVRLGLVDLTKESAKPAVQPGLIRAAQPTAKAA